eukprot:TRINITY_DN78624_c0_g1_i1.p1 TRINITY_DN78624_c0_g1~~TRINITY_DN78624_c0_g1_i1.p1  ORF type:complete len:287 (+),score=19.33 TRINITY_DN78624_c0_g1_i1:67-861(+)
MQSMPWMRKRGSHRLVHTWLTAVACLFLLDPGFVSGVLNTKRIHASIVKGATGDSNMQGGMPEVSRRTVTNIFNVAFVAYLACLLTRLPLGGYIAALGDPSANSGSGAETWGIWRQDPGPRGVRLSSFRELEANGNVAPADWKFDAADWWLEEHGLIMPQPETPLPPGKYVVTGDREVISTLTVHPKDAEGSQRWELSNGAKLHDVTHLPCRSARYTPTRGGDACSPADAISSDFPVAPGARMPFVKGCEKQDYAVLFVLGLPA